jgi:hypothetical protein
MHEVRICDSLVNVAIALIYLQVCSYCLRNILQGFKNLNKQLGYLIYDEVQ